MKSKSKRDDIHTWLNLKKVRIHRYFNLLPEGPESANVQHEAIRTVAAVKFAELLCKRNM